MDSREICVWQKKHKSGIDTVETRSLPKIDIEIVNERLPRPFSGVVSPAPSADPLRRPSAVPLRRIRLECIDKDKALIYRRNA
ncbi:hypothetical protein EVAR_4168_1 [Eumeta japonica]|uniref:Uncharacterized protein n=1 Tax=Eumeta variegata TaxID=151549 RepID=A0A4C1TIZ4_EUMVA|nr:hypothetical protein EVAR_4168_1 [Eumeta japonica]